MTTTIGSLCSGYGGLDKAAEIVTGGVTVWHCEYDAAPSTLLAHHFPGLTNFGDLKALEWAKHYVRILTAGYPCQPFSGAGKRLGTDDPRHLFPWIVMGVERMRPELLLFENVRGHLSLGFDVVLAELDRIGYDVRWTLLRAADVGAPHGRSRLWIAARAREVGGWPEPMGHPTAYLDGGAWVDPASGLFGGIEAQRPGTAGVMVEGGRWDTDATVVNTGTLLLPTPAAHDSGNTPEQHLRKKPGRSQVTSLQVIVDYGLLATGGQLLPTPAVNDMGAGKTVEAWDDWTAAQKAKHGNGNGHGPSLHIEAARMALLPTQNCMDGMEPRSDEAVARARLTAGCANLKGTDLVRTGSQSWGPYTAAIRRWEAFTRPAPPPTEQGKNGPRLSPVFVEWMQGLPAGWVVDVPGMTRNNALKLLGNGVVSQCAEVAYGLLGVTPDLLAQEVAA